MSRPARRLCRALLLAALVLCGCPGVTAPLERPRLHLEQVAAHAGEELHVRVRLRVHNPNATAVHARALDWALLLGDAPLVRGRAELDKRVPARESAALDIDLALAAAPAGAMTARMDSGHRGYRLRGTVHFVTERGDICAVFDESGRIGASRDESGALAPAP